LKTAGQRAPYRDLYRALGRAERLAVIAPASSLPAFQREFDDTLATSNGGLSVRFAQVAFSG
jgi:hypothetical protein